MFEYPRSLYLAVVLVIVCSGSMFYKNFKTTQNSNYRRSYLRHVMFQHILNQNLSFEHLEQMNFDYGAYIVVMDEKGDIYANGLVPSLAKKGGERPGINISSRAHLLAKIEKRSRTGGGFVTFAWSESDEKLQLHDAYVHFLLDDKIALVVSQKENP
jgi:hypothetical protein